MRPDTAPSGRRPLPGFDSRRFVSRPPSEASKVRPLKRSLSSKTSAALMKSDSSLLRPVYATTEKLSLHVQRSSKQNFSPLKRVNTFQLFQALKDTIRDTKDVMELVKCGSNINRKIMRRSSLHLQKQRVPKTRVFLRAKAPGLTQKLTKEPSLVSLMRECARLQATAEPYDEPDTIVVVPKPPANCAAPPHEEEVARPFELRVSVDSFSRAEVSHDVMECSSSPTYTFVSQLLDQLAPKTQQTQLKRKLRGRLVRLAA